ncbi:MAG TPA: hypothetical protein VLB06_12675 [Sulfuricaulis sp.]|nr:hypothetical protein [Sulfuricaulis sp.]
MTQRRLTMPFQLTVLRVLLLLVAATTLLGLVLDPELVLQALVRGGFVLAGVGLTLALRPRDEALSPAR